MMDLNDSNLDALFSEAQIELFKKSYFEFFKHFWPTVVADPLVLNWHIEFICNEVQKVGKWVIERKPKEYDLLINVPPGTTKSTIVSVLFPAWLWINDPSIRIIGTSYSESSALPHALKSRDCIMSPEYEQLFAQVVIRNDNYKKTEYENTLKGQRITTSTGGSVTSKHAHLIIVDDPHKPPQKAEVNAVDEPHALAKANDWHDVTLSTRKVSKENTPTIFVMQRLHEADLSGHLLKKRKHTIKHICLPAEWDEEIAEPKTVKENYIDGLLDPVRLSRKVLDNEKITLGIDYAGQFQQRPAPAEGNILKKEWFQTFNVADVPDNLPRWFYSDTAYGNKTKGRDNDKSATICFSTWKNNLYIWNVWKDDLEFPDFIRQYKNFLQANNYDQRSKAYFEPKASGLSIIQQLKRETIFLNGDPAKPTGINVIADDPPRDSKITRVKGVSAIIQAGRVFILNHQSWHNGFIAECIQFPNSAHDDQVDVLVGAIKVGLLKNNFVIMAT